jgi:ribonucleoside-diphosphate reductase alpha chain
MSVVELAKKVENVTHPSKDLPVYNYETVFQASLKYFNGDELAASVWINKYALKDSEENIYELTPDDMHHRMAREIARIEKLYTSPLMEDEIFDLFKNFKYIIPQGGPMSGIGNSFQKISLSNCFVIGNEFDSYSGILRTDEEQVQLMKRRGGVGHDLSHIRPKGSAVQNSAITSTGIVPFMERYSNSTREVAQDGRRGALMLSVSIQHPDAEDFINAKLEQGKVTGANISVKIDDAFMKAAVNGTSYQQQYPVYSTQPKVKKEVDAKKLWQKIVHNAWKSAEPGILFWDTIIKESVPDCYADLGYRTVSTNPCGEIPLCPYDSCRLLALNLYSYVENPFTDKATFNFPLFIKHVGYAQKIMDDIIDLEIEKIDAILLKINEDPEAAKIKTVEHDLWIEIMKKCVEGRRTGIGITAEGDMLAALGLIYGSDESIEFCTKVHEQLALGVYKSSVRLAKERGTFPIYDGKREMNNPFINRLKSADVDFKKDLEKYGRRNIALLTIAPTGTTSLMAQTSSGIEPVFMVSYKRRKKVNPNDKDVQVSYIDEVGDHWQEYNVFHHKFIDWLKVKGYDVEAVKQYNDEELQKIVAKSPYYKATANDIDWVQKVKLQGAVQKWVDHSISVTVNIPNEATEELVADIYKTAWEVGCKGVTVYRDGSRGGVLVSNKEEEKEEKTNLFIESRPPKRPKKLEAEVIRFQNDYEKWVAVVGLFEGKPYEIFTGKAEDTFMLPPTLNNGWIIKKKDDNGNNRYDFQYEDKDGYKVTMEGLSRSFDKEFWNYAKLISGILRHGMPLLFVIDLISELNLGNDYINTWKNGVIRALKKFVPDGTVSVKNKCTSCGDPNGMVYIEGCMTCNTCGYSKCT